jgi:hypothetical protein
LVCYFLEAHLEFKRTCRFFSILFWSWYQNDQISRRVRPTIKNVIGCMLCLWTNRSYKIKFKKFSQVYFFFKNVKIALLTCHVLVKIWQGLRIKTFEIVAHFHYNRGWMWCDIHRYTKTTSSGFKIKALKSLGFRITRNTLFWS